MVLSPYTASAAAAVHDPRWIKGEISWKATPNSPPELSLSCLISISTLDSSQTKLLTAPQNILPPPSVWTYAVPSAWKYLHP